VIPYVPPFFNIGRFVNWLLLSALPFFLFFLRPSFILLFGVFHPSFYVVLTNSVFSFSPPFPLFSNSSCPLFFTRLVHNCPLLLNLLYVSSTLLMSYPPIVVPFHPWDFLFPVYPSLLSRLFSYFPAPITPELRPVPFPFSFSAPYEQGFPLHLLIIFRRLPPLFYPIPFCLLLWISRPPPLLFPSYSYCLLPPHLCHYSSRFILLCSPSSPPVFFSPREQKLLHPSFFAYTLCQYPLVVPRPPRLQLYPPSTTLGFYPVFSFSFSQISPCNLYLFCLNPFLIPFLNPPQYKQDSPSPFSLLFAGTLIPSVNP